jgi:hypothetical protein
LTASNIIFTIGLLCFWVIASRFRITGDIETHNSLIAAGFLWFAIVPCVGISITVTLGSKKLVSIIKVDDIEYHEKIKRATERVISSFLFFSFLFSSFLFFSFLSFLFFSFLFFSFLFFSFLFSLNIF